MPQEVCVHKMGPCKLEPFHSERETYAMGQARVRVVFSSGL